MEVKILIQNKAGRQQKKNIKGNVCTFNGNREKRKKKLIFNVTGVC